MIPSNSQFISTAVIVATGVAIVCMNKRMDHIEAALATMNPAYVKYQGTNLSLGDLGSVLNVFQKSK